MSWMGFVARSRLRSSAINAARGYSRLHSEIDVSSRTGVVHQPPGRSASQNAFGSEWRPHNARLPDVLFGPGLCNGCHGSETGRERIPGVRVPADIILARTNGKFLNRTGSADTVDRNSALRNS